MKFQAYLVLLAISVTNCTDYPDPTITTVEDTGFYCYEFNHRGFAGTYLPDSITVFASDRYSYWALKDYKVQFSIIRGGGEPDRDEVLTDKYGRATIHWRLGESGSIQQMEASLFNPEGKQITTIQINAWSFRSDSWDSIMDFPDVRFSDMAADTLNGMTYALGDLLFIQGERYFDWTPILLYPDVYPVTIEIGIDGVLYCTNWKGQVCRSTDHGKNWLFCTSIWRNHTAYTDLKVTTENYLWATAPNRPLGCSRDGGITWDTTARGIPATVRLQDIFRMSGGNLFLLSQNGQLFKSEDDGHSWRIIDVPEYIRKLYITNQDVIILFGEHNGISIYKSSDNGDHFIQKHSVWPVFYSQMNNTVQKAGTNYYITIPGYGILITTDFEAYENYWVKSDLYDMFIDDRGNLIARGPIGHTVYYRHNSEP